MKKAFLTQEIGSIQRPIWRQKLGAPADPEWISGALQWGEKFGVSERYELANAQGTGLLQKHGADRAEDEKARIVEIAGIYVIRMFEAAGLDRVYNGEQPRTEMYDTFASRADNISTAGFVNSFDWNYFRKGILEGRVSVKGDALQWFKEEYEFTARNTSRAVKPCVTGPYTMADWSFPEYYLGKHGAPGIATNAISAAARREAVLDFAENVLNPIVKEYARAGASVIQLDEPAASTRVDESGLLVEGINASFKGIPHGVEKAVHFCYSDYPSLFPALCDSVADSYLIECTNHAEGADFGQSSISANAFDVIGLFNKHGLSVNIGAGVADIHSDQIESPELICDRILHVNALVGDPGRVQVNPDCGLRTRRWDVAFAKLVNMVKGAELARREAGV